MKLFIVAIDAGYRLEEFTADTMKKALEQEWSYDADITVKEL